METKKKPTDAQILDKVIKTTRLTRNGFSVKCKYKSAMSIYNVLEGKNDMSEDMKTRIAVTFPEINYSYLNTGEGPILKPYPDKYNIETDYEEQATGTLSDFAQIPATLIRIEKLMEDILEALQK